MSNTPKQKNKLKIGLVAYKKGELSPYKVLYKWNEVKRYNKDKNAVQIPKELWNVMKLLKLNKLLLKDIQDFQNKYGYAETEKDKIELGSKQMKGQGEKLLNQSNIKVKTSSTTQSALQTAGLNNSIVDRNDFVNVKFFDNLQIWRQINKKGELLKTNATSKVAPISNSNGLIPLAQRAMRSQSGLNLSATVNLMTAERIDLL